MNAKEIITDNKLREVYADLRERHGMYEAISRLNKWIQKQYSEAYATQSLPSQISNEEIKKEAEQRYLYFINELQLIKREIFIEGAKWAINRTALPREGWISVEDRLPENEKHVLGIDNNSAIMNVAYYPNGAYVACDDSNCELEHDSDDMCQSSEKGFYQDNEQIDSEYEIVVFKRNITHWQPLPKPPRTDNTQEITTKN